MSETESSEKKKQGRPRIIDNAFIVRTIVCIPSIDLEKVNETAKALKIPRSKVIRLAIACVLESDPSIFSKQRYKVNLIKHLQKLARKAQISKRLRGDFKQICVGFSKTHYDIIEKTMLSQAIKMSTIILYSLEKYYEKSKIRFEYT